MLGLVEHHDASCILSKRYIARPSLLAYVSAAAATQCGCLRSWPPRLASSASIHVTVTCDMMLIACPALLAFVSGCCTEYLDSLLASTARQQWLRGSDCPGPSGRTDAATSAAAGAAAAAAADVADLSGVRNTPVP
jgi:hypothetical protein